MTDAEDGPYCRDCGNDDRRKLACEHTPANGVVYRCTVCDGSFLYSRARSDA